MIAAARGRAPFRTITAVGCDRAEEDRKSRHP